MATTLYSDNYNSDGSIVQGRLNRTGGAKTPSCSVTITTAGLNEANDAAYLIPLNPGTYLKGWLLTSGKADTHGTPTLDADIVVRYASSLSANTDVVVYDSSALSLLFSAAKVSEPHLIGSYKVPDSGFSTMAHLVFKVNTAAATAAQVTLKLVLFVDSYP